jgi:lipoprotein NlpI
VASYQTTVTLQPTHAPAWNNLGVLWQAQSDWPRAREAYQNALRADPQHEQARINLQSLPAPAP